MKLKLAIHVDCPPANPTGIGRYMVELTQAIASAGHHPEGWARWRWRRQAEKLFSSVPVRVHPLLSTGRFTDGLLPAVYSRLRGINLVHSPNGCLLPENSRFRQTVMVHDLAFLMLSDTKPPGEAAAWERKVANIVEGADGIMVNSRCTETDLLNHFPKASGKTWLTRLGIDHLMPSVKARPSRGEHLLAVGTVEPRKNIPMLIRAYEEVWSGNRDLPPLVIAGGMGYRSDEILEAAGASPAAEKIGFTGYVSEKQLAELYRKAVCLVHPALYEGFGFTVPEALGFGLPVVCSGNSALGELYGEAVYAVDPLDHLSIASGMAEALEKGLTEEARAAGEDLFRELTWRNCADATIRAFSEILR